VKITTLLNKVRKGSVSVRDALEQLSVLPFVDIGHTKIDHHRALRKGYPEVIFGEGKTPGQIAEIAFRIAARSGEFLITRIDEAAYNEVRSAVKGMEYDSEGRIAFLKKKRKQKKGLIVVITAGTSDSAVANEITATARVLGNRVRVITDVGVAGVHRVLKYVKLIRRANVICVVAGMDGALPSLVGGLVKRPVIAVPTSVGYGACFKGIAPLLTMLNTCAPGVSVMNIDNGFGAGYFASMINK